MKFLSFEELEVGIHAINEKLGTNIGKLSKLNSNRQSNDYRKYYNNKSIKLVEKLFADDIKHLGYRF